MNDCALPGIAGWVRVPHVHRAQRQRERVSDSINGMDRMNHLRTSAGGVSGSGAHPRGAFGASEEIPLASVSGSKSGSGPGSESGPCLTGRDIPRHTSCGSVREEKGVVQASRRPSSAGWKPTPRESGPSRYQRVLKRRKAMAVSPPARRTAVAGSGTTPDWSSPPGSSAAGSDHSWKPPLFGRVSPKRE